jgi:hypothetical protein
MDDDESRFCGLESPKTICRYQSLAVSEFMLRFGLLTEHSKHFLIALLRLFLFEKSS